MLIELVLIATLLSSAVAKINENFNKDRRDDDWNEELRFWSDIACRAGRNRMFSFHEIPKTEPSRRLYDFFGDMITNVQTKCGATTQTKSYRDYDYKDNDTYTRSLSGEKNFKEILGKSLVFIEKSDKAITRLSTNKTTRLFPQRRVEILLVLMDDSVRMLMKNGNVFKNWDNGRHVLILMITKKEVNSNTSKLLADTFVILLQRLWHERGVLNVFFAAPFSTLGRLVWFYNPFVENATNVSPRGKIFARKVSRIPSIDRLTNLQGYRLNIGMFEAKPAAIKYHPKNSHHLPFVGKLQAFVGIDGLTMETIARHMNFTYNIVPPTDGVEFGYVHSNGTFIGTIGDAAHHKIDIGFNSMYMKIYTQHEHCTNTIEFTTPIDFDRMCIVVPRARKIPRWLRTFYYFNPAVWICLVITHIIVALVWYIIRNIRVSTTKCLKKRSTYRSLLVSTFFLFIGSPVSIKASQIERIILASLLLFGVTIMGTITGILYDTFTNELHYKEIDSLKELDNSGIPIATASPNLKDVFSLREEADDPEEIRSLRKKFKVIDYDDISTIEKTAYRRNVASLSRENVFAVSRHRYVDDTGDSLIHLVAECPRSYYLSYVMPKNSVYKKRVDTLITRLLQAGLPPLWNSVTTEGLINVVGVKANSHSTGMESVPFNLRDLQTAFILLTIGHAIAICIFIVELLSYDKEKRAACRISDKIIKLWENGFCRICKRKTSKMFREK